MGKFGYKDGCIECNECGRLHDPDRADDLTVTGCPCGNSETLEAIDDLLALYNKPAPPRTPDESGEKTPAPRSQP